MKKVIWKDDEEGEAVIIYFNFEKDFPQLGCTWICIAGGDRFTDCDWQVDDELNDIIKSKIENLYQEECGAKDYDYVQGLVEAWGL